MTKDLFYDDPNGPYPHNAYDIDKIWPRTPYEYRCRITPAIMGTEIHNRSVLEAVRAGINDGAFTGTQALEAADLVCFGKQIYHGSRILPEELEGGRLHPRRSHWRADDELLYRDGEPAVCFSPDPETAILRAFSTKNLSDGFCAYGRTNAGRLWRMFSTATLQQAQDRTACVYTVRSSAVPLYQFPKEHNREPEYRSLKPIDYDLAVRIGASALPPDLLVMDGDKMACHAAWAKIMSGIHPLDLRGVHITRLGGIDAWDISDHPRMR